MVLDRHTQLCTRIHEHCHSREWYGPDGDNPAERGRYQYVYGWHPPENIHLPYAHTRGCACEHSYDPASGLHTWIVDNATDPRLRAFELPPATEEQLRATEAALGYGLPPVLRAVYAQVANGGFGPDYGITGAAGGWTMADDGRYETLDRIDLRPVKSEDVRYVDLSEYDRNIDRPFNGSLPYAEYPDHLLPFCYCGCNMDACVDLGTGRVYMNLGGICDGEGRPCYHFARLALSVEEWLENWLRDDSHNKMLGS